MPLGLIAPTIRLNRRHQDVTFSLGCYPRKGEASIFRTCDHPNIHSARRRFQLVATGIFKEVDDLGTGGYPGAMDNAGGDVVGTPRAVRPGLVAYRHLHLTFEHSSPLTLVTMRRHIDVLQKLEEEQLPLSGLQHIGLHRCRREGKLGLGQSRDDLWKFQCCSFQVVQSPPRQTSRVGLHLADQPAILSSNEPPILNSLDEFGNSQVER